MSIFRRNKKLILSLLLIAVVIAGVFPVIQLRQASLSVPTESGQSKLIYRVFGAGLLIPVAHAQGTPDQLGGQRQPTQITQTQQAAQPVQQATAAGTQQNQPAQPQTGNAIGGLNAIFGSTSWFYGLVLAFLILVRSLFVVLLTLSGNLLSILFEANILLVPSTEAVVRVGWVVLRDLVNGVFILLVLWIALTIILGIEQYGGKKLLAKVLAVAILINFSLAIVTGIFVLSNQFAKAFYDKIAVGAKNAKGDVDIASYIVNVTRLQTIAANTLNKDQADRLAAAQEEGARIRAGNGAISFGSQFREGIFASVGFQSAEAVGTPPESTFDCGRLSSPQKEQCTTAQTFWNDNNCTNNISVRFTTQPTGCQQEGETIRNFGLSLTSQVVNAAGAVGTVANGVNYVGDFFKGIAAETGDWSKVTFTQALNAVIGIILLGIAVTTFLYAAVALAMRYFMVIFLAIASPVAFLTIALPLGYGKSEGWDHWWKEFMKWVFFAPAFYFLIYLTLIMAYNYKTAFQSESGISITSNPNYILAMVIVMGTLMYASRLAKKTSGKAGEITVGLAKKAAGLAVGVTAGIATGGTLMAARGLARGAVKPGTRREAFTRGLARYVPGGRAIQRAGIRSLEEQKRDVEERKKSYGSYSNDQIQADFRGTNIDYTKENAARLATLAERKDGFKGMTESEMKRVQAVLSHYNMGDVVTKVAPTLADEKSIRQKGQDAIKTGRARNEANNNAPLDADDAVTYAAKNLTTQDIPKVNTSEIAGDNPENEKVRQGMWMNTNMSKNSLETIATNDLTAGQKMVESLHSRIEKLMTAKVGANATQQAEIDKELKRLEDKFRGYFASTAAQSLGFKTPKAWLDPVKLTGNLPNASSGNAYNIDLSSRVVGGDGKYAWDTAHGVVINGVRTGLTIDANGNITGNMTGVGRGVQTLTLKVIDGNGTEHTVNTSINVQ